MMILIISLLVYCFCSFNEFLKLPPHLLISGSRPFHSYGPLIWNMNDFNEFLTSMLVPPKVFTFYKCSDLQGVYLSKSSSS